MLTHFCQQRLDLDGVQLLALLIIFPIGWRLCQIENRPIVTNLRDLTLEFLRLGRSKFLMVKQLNKYGRLRFAVARFQAFDTVFRLTGVRDTGIFG